MVPGRLWAGDRDLPDRPEAAVHDRLWAAPGLPLRPEAVASEAAPGVAALVHLAAAVLAEAAGAAVLEEVPEGAAVLVAAPEAGDSVDGADSFS